MCLRCVLIGTLVVLLSFAGSAQAAQNGYCFNEKVGWLNLSGLTFSPALRAFSGTATYSQGAFPGGAAQGIVNFSASTGQAMGLTVGVVPTSNELPVTGQGWSPQIGWVFASHAGSNPLRVIATGSNSGTLVGSFWSSAIGYFNCASAVVGAGNVHRIDLPADTDADGCSDAQEVTDGTNASDGSSYLDNDNDGVPNCVEIAAGTNPNIASSFVDSDSDGVSDYREQRCMNGGDGNDDGIADAVQGSVACVRNTVLNGTTTLVVNGGCSIVQAFAIVAESTLSVQDAAADYPAGLAQFRLQCTSPGQGGQIDILYDRLLSTTDWTFKKYNPTTNIFFDITPSVTVTFGTHSVSGNSVTKVSYTVTDGNSLTDFNAAPALIDDPAGPAAVASSSSSSATAAFTTVTNADGGGAGPGPRMSIPAVTLPENVSRLFEDSEMVKLSQQLRGVRFNAATYAGKCIDSLDVLGLDGVDVTYADVPRTAWYHDTIQLLTKGKVVSGLRDVNGLPLWRFEPERAVNYAEGSAMILRAAREAVSEQPGEYWYRPYLALGVKNGLTRYLREDMPSAPLRRAEAIPLILIASCVSPVVPQNFISPFLDVPVTHPEYERIRQAAYLQVVTGYGDATFRPGRTVTRAEFGAMILRALRIRYVLLNRS